jgi:hypothetical protein
MTVVQAIEKLPYEPVLDLLARGVVFEMPLRDVGFTVRSVNQHAVPGFILRRATLRDGLVPLVVEPKGQVDIVHDTAITKPLVTNQLTDGELRRDGLIHSVSLAPINTSDQGAHYLAYDAPRNLI